MVACAPLNTLALDYLTPAGAALELRDLPFVVPTDAGHHVDSAWFQSRGDHSEDLARGRFMAVLLRRYLAQTGAVGVVVDFFLNTMTQTGASDGFRIGANTTLAEYAMATSFEEVGRRTHEMNFAIPAEPTFSGVLLAA